ncbi:aminotransferase class III-fold pyridoxal phosphate-dependent enzyme, partial [Kingella kingae]
NAPETLAHVAAQSEKLQAALQQIAQETGVFQNVRGQGLLLGAVLAKPYENQVIGLVQAALQHGLMVLGAGGNVLRFAPSLLLSDEDLHEGMNRLRHAIAAWQTSLTA